MRDVMLDLETLGTRHDARIIQVGACYFDRETGAIGDEFLANIDGTQFHDDFTVDYHTIKWWFSQSDAARDLVMKDAFGFIPALEGLNSFLSRNGTISLWSHATFDMPILAHAFNICGIKHPVPFRNMRDIRTLMDLAGPSAGMIREGTHHHALDDAKYQAQYVADAIRRLNAKK